MTGYTTGDNNQVTSDGTYNYQYDDEGNRTRKTNISTGAYVDYTWDHRNRLTAVTYRTSGGTKTKEVTYTYDVFDRRIAKDVDDDGNGTIDWGERYAYDREDIIFVFDETDALEERILHGPGIDQSLATEDGSGNVLWLLADNQGTIRDIASYNAGTDTTTVVNHIQYDGFGNITAQSNSTYEPRFTYTGREWDADAELFYYRARWYDPAIGRFISEDPIGFVAGDTNISRYVGNGTPNFTDPSGLELVNGIEVPIGTNPDLLQSGSSVTSNPTQVEVATSPPSGYGNHGMYLHPDGSVRDHPPAARPPGPGDHGWDGGTPFGPNPRYPVPPILGPTLPPDQQQTPAEPVDGVGGTIFAGFAVASVVVAFPGPFDDAAVLVVGVNTVLNRIGLGFTLTWLLTEDHSPSGPGFPGNDATQAPEGYEWRGRPGSTPGSPQGNHHNPNTGESLRPDLNHPEGIEPHWDYCDPSGKWWRIFPDGHMEPK